MTMTPKRVGIVIFDDVEVLDYCGPFEVFSVAATVRANDGSVVNSDTALLFQVSLIAASDDAVITTAGGMRVLPDCGYNNAPALDVLLIPGGDGARKEMVRPSTLKFVKKQQAATATTLVTSVCTGALVLAKAGLLDGKTVTTHWTCLDLLQDICPACTVDRTKHWIKDGDVFTSAGISAGIDMSLKVVEHYYGEEIARSTAKFMEYPFPDSDERRINLETT
jgi:transcriptional regulator GlxA family with amidase domain